MRKCSTVLIRNKYCEKEILLEKPNPESLNLLTLSQLNNVHTEKKSSQT